MKTEVRKAVIPVAGLGTRGLPFTKSVPKELIPILETPVLQWVVQEAAESGIKEVVFVTSPHKEAIRVHFEEQSELTQYLTRKKQPELVQKVQAPSQMARFQYVIQENPLGLGHAILTAQSLIGEEPFAVLLPDEIFDSSQPCTQQLMDIFRQKGSGVVGVIPVADKDVSKYGIVEGTEKGERLIQVNRVVEKPSPKEVRSRWALPGRYVLPPTVFEALKRVRPSRNGEIQLTDALQNLAETKDLWAYALEAERFDTGDRLGWLEANLVWALKRPELREGVQGLLRKYASKG